MWASRLTQLKAPPPRRQPTLVGNRTQPPAVLLPASLLRCRPTRTKSEPGWPAEASCSLAALRQLLGPGAPSTTTRQRHRFSPFDTPRFWAASLCALSASHTMASPAVTGVKRSYAAMAYAGGGPSLDDRPGSRQRLQPRSAEGPDVAYLPPFRSSPVHPPRPISGGEDQPVLTCSVSRQPLANDAQNTSQHTPYRRANLVFPPHTRTMSTHPSS